MIRVLCAGYLALLAGCAEFMPRPAESPQASRTAAWEARVARLTPLKSFALNGRIAVQHEAQGGQARVQWEQADESFSLRLSAPLGQGSFALKGDAEQVSLQTPDGQTYTATDLDSLMATHMQWTLPVAGARYWIRGLPVPNHPVAQLNLDDQGRLIDLAQDGWRISVLEYHGDLPRKIFMLGDKLQLRLLIAQWNRPPE